MEWGCLIFEEEISGTKNQVALVQVDSDGISADSLCWLQQLKLYLHLFKAHWEGIKNCLVVTGTMAFRMTFPSYWEFHHH